MHIWQKETAAQRRAADEHLAKLNAELKPIAKAK